MKHCLFLYDLDFMSNSVTTKPGIFFKFDFNWKKTYYWVKYTWKCWTFSSQNMVFLTRYYKYWKKYSPRNEKGVLYLLSFCKKRKLEEWRSCPTLPCLALPCLALPIAISKKKAAGMQGKREAKKTEKLLPDWKKACEISNVHQIGLVCLSKLPLFLPLQMIACLKKIQCFIHKNINKSLKKW